MTPQNGPSSRQPVSLSQLHEAVAYQPDEVEICALISPVGIQVQLFYADFRLESALYGLGLETIDITNIIYESHSVPQFAMENFNHAQLHHGTFDISGLIYFSPASLQKINTKRALEGRPTFRYIESAIQHTLKTTEFADELQFTPNWSDTITVLRGINTYQMFLDILNEDFQVMDHMVSTVKLVENLYKFAKEIQQLDQLGDDPPFVLKSMVLFGNDISRRTVRSCAETNIIAEILINEEPSSIKIDAIGIEPDRYGRVRPVIASNEVNQYESEFHTINLLNLYELEDKEYQVGDVIEVKFVNRIPKLGRIIEKSLKPKEAFDKTTCYACGSKFVKRNGQLYCIKPHCPSTVFYRMLYANQKNVLDLPFDWHSLHDLVMLQGVVFDIPSLFNLERTNLMGNFDTDLIDLILKTLHTRIAQLNGDGFSSEVQYNAQAKFLDALSIPGLHRANIKKLVKSLYEGDWQWPELPLVLTSQRLLREAQIPNRDVIEIITSAEPRLIEFDTLVRKF